MNTDEKNEYLKRVSKLREFIKFTGFYELAKEFGLQYGQKCGDILHKNRCEECLDINNSICPAELELGVELMERTEKQGMVLQITWFINAIHHFNLNPRLFFSRSSRTSGFVTCPCICYLYCFCQIIL